MVEKVKALGPLSIPRHMIDINKEILVNENEKEEVMEHA